MQTPDANLSQAMQWLNLSYAAWFNTRHQRRGPVYQRPFGSRPVEDGLWAYDLSLYIHLNPLRIKALGLGKGERKAESRGLGAEPTSEQVTQRLARLRKFAWSSYPAYAGYRKAPEWLHTEDLLERASEAKAGRHGAYRRDVQAVVKQGVEPGRMERLRDAVAVGGSEFLCRVKELTKEGGLGREISGKRALRDRTTMAEVIECVEAAKGEKWDDFAHRHGDPGVAMAMWLARRCTGLTLGQIGAAVGGKDYAAVHMALKRFGAKIKEDKQLCQRTAQAASLLNVEMSPQ